MEDFNVKEIQKITINALLEKIKQQEQIDNKNYIDEIEDKIISEAHKGNCSCTMNFKCNDKSLFDNICLYLIGKGFRCEIQNITPQSDEILIFITW